jgi:hypothetical protein
VAPGRSEEYGNGYGISWRAVFLAEGRDPNRASFQVLAALVVAAWLVGIAFLMSQCVSDL